MDGAPPPPSSAAEPRPPLPAPMAAPPPSTSLLSTASSMPTPSSPSPPSSASPGNPSSSGGKGRDLPVRRPPVCRLTARINRAVLRAGIVASAAGSTFAVGFLMVALVNLVQVRLGRIGFHGGEGALPPSPAVVALLTLVPRPC
uniref:Uncharacterized protein n=1 Tax=Ananas comosus var. bracteatus TaxID=296719 RepID=A0A6V7NU27_ANACO|nr:unnamed protein product [Ananas comosus var. bracteatus]